MESMDRRSFLDKASKAGLTAMFGLDTALTLKSSSERIPTKTTDEAPNFVAPIVHAPEAAVEVAKTTDGVARVDSEGTPVIPTEREHFRETISYRTLRERPPFEFAFNDGIRPPNIDAAAFERPKYDSEGNPVQLSSIKAMAAHTMRFKPILDAVERRYALPRGLLTAFVMQESTGLDLLPNSRGDGGFGLIHMQNATAHEFGLRVSGDPEKVVDKANGAELAFLMKRDGGSTEGRAVLNAHDERLDILANVDAAGRMLASWAADPFVASQYPKDDPLSRAIARYCGPKNKEAYLGRISLYMSLINDTKYLQGLSQEFAQINTKRTMPDRSPVTMEKWLAKHHEYCRNAYPVDEYSQLPLLKTKVSDEISQTYQGILESQLRQFREKAGKSKEVAVK